MSSKFVIDGKIEEHSAGRPIQTQPSGNSGKSRLWIIILVVISFSLMMLSMVLFLELRSLKSQLITSNPEEEQVQTTKAPSDKEVDSLQNEIIRLKMKMEHLEEESNVSDGVFFEVQIGNFSGFNLDAFEGETENLQQEKTKSGYKLTVGRFRSFQKALLFEREMRKLGFSSAFIVGRINGNPVMYQEALKYLQQSDTLKE